MPDLDTITLSELDTITEMGENDKVLVESNGRMKRCSGSLGGGGGVCIEITEHPNTEGRRIIELTPTELSTMLSSGQIPIFHNTPVSEYDSEQYASFSRLQLGEGGSCWLTLNSNGIGDFYYDANEYEGAFLEYWD